MYKRLLAFTIIVLAVSAILLPAYAQGSRPTIHVTPPPSKNFPLKIYVYPRAYDLDSGAEFTCPHQDELVTMFYHALRSFRKAVLRFVDEYPEYSKLAEITFVNTTSLDQADIAFRVVKRLEGERVVAYTNFTGAWTPYRSEICVECSIFDNGTREFVWSVILHELGHALGLGHAFQPFTENEHPELMSYIPEETREKIWPSTLDLYAIYELYFHHEFEEVYENVTLPSKIEYKMVIPYDAEIQRLKEERDHLWTKLREANDLITNLQDENRKLRDRYERLMEVAENLDLEAQLLQQVLDRCQGDRERLKAKVEDLEDRLHILAKAYNESLTKMATVYNQHIKACQKALEETQFRYQILIYAITGIAMAMILAIYMYARKHGVS